MMRRAPPFWEVIRVVGHDMLAAFPPAAYEEEILSVRFLGRDYIYLMALSAIEHVFVRHADRYHRDTLGRRLLAPIAGSGLLLSEGDAWRAQRRTLAPAFQPRSIDRLAPQFAARAARVIGGWSPGPRNLFQDFHRLTLSIAAATMFSIDDPQQEAELTALTGQFERAAGRLRFSDYLAAVLPVPVPQPAVRRAFRKRFGAWVEGFVIRAEAGRQEEAADVLGLIRAARDPETGAGLSRRQIVDQIGTMIVAGFETTALALFWCAALLACHPAHQERARRDSFFARAFVMESLRLYPPIPITSRRALIDDEILGRKVPRGACVNVSSWIVHRHRLHWEAPEAFDPGRFLKDGQIVTPPAWIPFGTGPRICIGMRFALSEIQAVLATLLDRYRLSLPEGQPPRPVARLALLPEHEPIFDLTAL